MMRKTPAWPRSKAKQHAPGTSELHTPQKMRQKALYKVQMPPKENGFTGDILIMDKKGCLGKTAYRPLTFR